MKLTGLTERQRQVCLNIVGNTGVLVRLWYEVTGEERNNLAILQQWAFTILQHQSLRKQMRDWKIIVNVLHNIFMLRWHITSSASSQPHPTLNLEIQTLM